MKFLIAVAALVAVASAALEVREKRGILSYAGLGSSSTSVITGPSGQIVSTQSNPGVVARSIYGAPAVYGPSVIASPSVYSAYGGAVVAAPSVYSGHGLLAPSAYAVAPGVTAGTVYAPGTTLVGPSTNGAPGAVITNSPYGSQILI